MRFFRKVFLLFLRLTQLTLRKNVVNIRVLASTEVSTEASTHHEQTVNWLTFMNTV